jgi:hypothetical protein
MTNNENMNPADDNRDDAPPPELVESSSFYLILLILLVTKSIGFKIFCIFFSYNLN